MSKNLSDIKEGDKVWVGGSRADGRDRIQTVLRVTPTQIVTDGHPERFKRSNGWQFGVGGMTASRIGGVATPEECERWEAEQEQKRQAREAAKAETDARDRKRHELNALFGENAYVQSTHTNLAGEWQVCIYTSEEGVRRLAELVSKLSANV